MKKIPECRIMNECLDTLASSYATFKFCKVRSGEISLSDKFVRHNIIKFFKIDFILMTKKEMFMGLMIKISE